MRVPTGALRDHRATPSQQQRPSQVGAAPYPRPSTIPRVRGLEELWFQEAAHGRPRGYGCWVSSPPVGTSRPRPAPSASSECPSPRRGPAPRSPAPPGARRGGGGPAGAGMRGGRRRRRVEEHVRAHPSSCRPARRQSPAERAGERGASAQPGSRTGKPPGHRAVAGRGSSRGAAEGPERGCGRRADGGGPRTARRAHRTAGAQVAGRAASRPRAPESGAAEPGRAQRPPQPAVFPGRLGAHDGGGDCAQGGRAGEAQRRAAAAVEAEALCAHRARAAALRGQGHRRPAQGAQLRPHQGRGMRGEHRAPHLFHAGDRGRRRDRLPLPPRGSRLERPDHPGPGQVQEPAGNPDCAGQAEPRGRDPRVLNRTTCHLTFMLRTLPTTWCTEVKSALLPLLAHGSGTVLHMSRRKPWSRGGDAGAEGMDGARGGGQKAMWG